MEHNCTHVAVGIGSFLYTYRTAEIKHLAPDHIKDDNIRRIKAGIISEIRNRFEQYNIAPVVLLISKYMVMTLVASCCLQSCHLRS